MMEKTTKETQNQKVLSYLLDGRSLTQKDAERMFGIGRLAARINNLKQKGWQVKSRMISVTGRDFTKVRVAQYFMDRTDIQKKTQGGLF